MHSSVHYTWWMGMPALSLTPTKVTKEICLTPLWKIGYSVSYCLVSVWSPTGENTAKLAPAAEIQRTHVSKETTENKTNGI